MGETYKVEHLEELPDHVSLYQQGSFLDLCEGPHVPSTGRIKAFRLLNVSGTYWRGDARNQGPPEDLRDRIPGARRH